MGRDKTGAYSVNNCLKIRPTRIMKRLEEMEERLDYYHRQKENIFSSYGQFQKFTYQ